MYIIADSSTAATDWALIDGNTVAATAVTRGLNPYYMTRREVSHSVRLELPADFFAGKKSRVFFYGAGCRTPETRKIIESSLVAQFRAPVTVEGNTLGAARGLFVDRPGIACIIGTGSNSCLYNGHDIVEQVHSLGFILGDEGSGSFIGKRFVADCLRGVAPANIREKFYARIGMTAAELLDSIYMAPFPNRTLAQFTEFLSGQIYNEYVYQMVYDSISSFFSRILSAYDYRSNDVGIVGKTACLFKEVVETVGADFGVKIKKIIPKSMPGLIEFHRKEASE